jgi:hypothetical protein
MKKKIELNKKTIKRLNLKLGQKNDRKVAPVVLGDVISPDTPTKGNCVTKAGVCW